MRNILSRPPLYIVDGEEEISKAKMELLDPDEIRSIDVLKGEAAIWTYGERGPRWKPYLLQQKRKKNSSPASRKVTIDTVDGKNYHAGRYDPVIFARITILNVDLPPP